VAQRCCGPGHLTGLRLDQDRAARLAGFGCDAQSAIPVSSQVSSRNPNRLPDSADLYSSGVTVSTGIDLGTLARIGMALADPTRRRALVRLTGGPGYPAEMAEEFGTTRANLSNHLACLRECGLVTATAEGRRVRYELADDRLADGLRILAALDLPGSCG
jgi:DNA-binding transcriptional ArsR family regulator